MNNKSITEIMKRLAESTDSTFDGDETDKRLHFDGDGLITVYCNLLDRKQYAAMEKAIRKACIRRKHYIVYAWNDISGFDYWNRGGETGDSNYIQITASVRNPSKVKASQLKRDLERIFNGLCHFHNVEAYHAKRMNESENGGSNE